MAEETLCDSEAMRRFAGIELGDDRIPDETTILNFRHLLGRHGLTQAIFADVNAHLADMGITLRSGTLADATIIDAPSSTKTKAGARDPEMSSTKTGNDRYDGMKAHIGVDADSRVTHSLETPTATLHDSQVWGVMRKAPKGRPLHPLDERANRIIAMVRARVEHPCRIIKRQFGHMKTRYRGLARTHAQLFTLFALGNLVQVRRRLIACGQDGPTTTKPPPRRA